MPPIAASRVLYIKLGRGGALAEEALADGTLRGGWRVISHALAARRDPAAIAEAYRVLGRAKSASNMARQVHEFCTAAEDVLWITFHAGLMYWCFAQPGVEAVPGAEDAEVATRHGFRLRRTLDGWRCRDVTGGLLRQRDLSGALTQVAAYQGTIADKSSLLGYVLARINATPSEPASRAQKAAAAFRQALVPLIRALPPQDFELLVDLIFARSGWRRVSLLGGTQKDIDLDLENAATGERAFVQVKCEASPAVIAGVRESFAEARSRGAYARLFLVSQSIDPAEIDAAPDEVVWGAAAIAAQVVDAGLGGWLMRMSPA